MKEKRQLSGRLCAALVAAAGCMWGTIGLFVRPMNAAGLSSLSIVELRSLITAAVLLVVTLCVDPKQLRVRLRDLWCFFGTGVCSVLFFNFCYFRTIEEGSMAVAATLLYTSPVFVMLLSLLLFREKITGRKVAALVMAMLGCVLVSGVLSDDGGFSGRAMLLGIAAGFGYGLYSIFSRYALQRGYSVLTITTYTFVFAAAGGALLTDFGAVWRAVSVGSWPMALLVVGCALMTTVAPYLCYTVGLSGMDNTRAAVIAAVEPVAAALFGLLFYREVPDLAATVGMLFVLDAVMLLTRPPRQPKQPHPPKQKRTKEL